MTGFYSFYDCSDCLCKYTAFPLPMSSLLGTSVAHHVLASAKRVLVSVGCRFFSVFRASYKLSHKEGMSFTVALASFP